MQKIIFILTALMICGTAYADNSVRIKELEEDIAKYQKFYNQLESQKTRILNSATLAQGAIAELKRQDAEAKKVEGK